MKRIIICINLLVLSFMLAGCGTTYLNAPANRSVKLLTKNAPASIRIEKKVWFKWWGAEPIDKPDTASIIQANNLREVRLKMTNTLGDGILSVFPGMIGFPRRTLIVEGNK